MEAFETSSEQLQRNDHASIYDVHLYSPLANSVRRELETLHPLSDKCCIYRVPKPLRQLDEKAYTPQVVSIGPLHHGREDLKAMEEHKRRYLQDFLRRTTVSLEDFVKLIKEKEESLRNCYAESIGLNSDDFVTMILVDAVFIIEVLMRGNLCELQTRNERIYAKPRMIFEIRQDMCLLENQLPFFILEEVFRLANIAKSFSLFKLASEFFEHLFLSVTKDLFGHNSSPIVEHFVDLLRICQQPLTWSPQRKLETLTIPSVTKLHQVGVKFKLAPNKSLFDIKFNNGILEIPKLQIHGDTELILKNLMAFERCHCADMYISDYVTFINFLVNTPKDVELLVQNGIIENLEEKSEGVPNVFQNLGKKTLLNRENYYFTALMEDLNVYCNSPWNKWKANLKQEYFRNPWTAISVVAAFILLVLTFIQTMCSIMLM